MRNASHEYDQSDKSLIQMQLGICTTSDIAELLSCARVSSKHS